MAALRTLLARPPLFFRKKLTVIGIMGHTHGVSSASRPPPKQAANIYHSEAVAALPLSLLGSAFTGAHSWSWLTLSATVAAAAAGCVALVESAAASVCPEAVAAVPLKLNGSLAGDEHWVSLQLM